VADNTDAIPTDMVTPEIIITPENTETLPAPSETEIPNIIEITAENTEVASEIPATDSTGAVPTTFNTVYTENFETEPLSNWSLGEGWTRAQTETGFALQSTQMLQRALFNPLMSDTEITFQVRWDAGQVHLHTHSNGLNEYQFSLSSDFQAVLYRNGVIVATALMPEFVSVQWQTITYRKVGSNIEILLNNTPLLQYFETEPLLNGQIALSAEGMTRAQWDEMSVKSGEVATLIDNLELIPEPSISTFSSENTEIQPMMSMMNSVQPMINIYMGINYSSPLSSGNIIHIYYDKREIGQNSNYQTLQLPGGYFAKSMYVANNLSFIALNCFATVQNSTRPQPYICIIDIPSLVNPNNYGNTLLNFNQVRVLTNIDEGFEVKGISQDNTQLLIRKSSFDLTSEMASYNVISNQYVNSYIAGNYSLCNGIATFISPISWEINNKIYFSLGNNNCRKDFSLMLPNTITDVDLSTTVSQAVTSFVAQQTSSSTTVVTFRSYNFKYIDNSSMIIGATYFIQNNQYQTIFNYDGSTFSPIATFTSSSTSVIPGAIISQQASAWFDPSPSTSEVIFSWLDPIYGNKVATYSTNASAQPYYFTDTNLTSFSSNGTLDWVKRVPANSIPTPTLADYGVTLSGGWTPQEQQAIFAGVQKVASAFRIQNPNIAPTDDEAFKKVMVDGDTPPYIYFYRTNSPSGQVTVTFPDTTIPVQTTQVNPGVCKTDNNFRPRTIICNWSTTPTTGFIEQTIVHELGHVFTARSGIPDGNPNTTTSEERGLLFAAIENTQTGNCSSSFSGLNVASNNFPASTCIFVADTSNARVMGNAGADTVWTRGRRGWGSSHASISIFQQNPSEDVDETAADMFLNWVYRKITNNPPTYKISIPGEWMGFLNKSWTDKTGDGIPDEADDNTYPGDARFEWMNNVMTIIFQAKGW
jgi:hypothetical protein